jgi:hypothetical protein
MAAPASEQCGCADKRGWQASEQCGHADERGGRQANEEEDVRVLDRRVGLWRGINVRLNLSLGVGCRQR